MSKVYLSYAPEAKERAEELRRILMARGHRPWREPQPTAGAPWHDEMDAAIRMADALIVLVTAAANSVFVTYEWALALGAGVPVFAILYDEAQEHPRLATVQRYDSRAFKDENRFWDHFVGDFNRQLQAGSAGKAAAQPEPEPRIDKNVMPTAPGYWLVMRRGPQPNRMYQLEREVATIGRDQANDIVIDDRQVSRYHLRLRLQGQAYLLEDLGSANGARVNGIQMSQPTRLNDGDLIALGDSVLLSYDLVYLDPAAADR